MQFKNIKIQNYRTNKPFPHAVIDDFLTQEDFEQLLSAMQEQEFYHKESDLFSLAQTKELTKTNNHIIKQFTRMLKSKEFTDWIKKTTGENIRTINSLFGAIYQDSDYLLCHDDQLENRKIAFILYLTTLPAKAGGRLLLYDNKNNHPNKIIKKIGCVENRLVLFTVSPESWHEVEEVKGHYNRVSIGGWFSE